MHTFILAHTVQITANVASTRASCAGRVRVVPGSSACRARVQCLPEVHAQVPTHLYLPRENFNFSPYILYVRTCTLRYSLTQHLSLVPSRIARQT